MDYQVWTKEEYGDNWKREDCGDLAAAKRTILANEKTGKEITLTVEVPFSTELKVGEPGGESKKKRSTKSGESSVIMHEEVKSEADQAETEQD